MAKKKKVWTNQRLNYFLRHKCSLNLSVQPVLAFLTLVCDLILIKNALISILIRYWGISTIALIYSLIVNFLLWYRWERYQVCRKKAYAQEVWSYCQPICPLPRAKTQKMSASFVNKLLIRSSFLLLLSRTH